VVRVINVLKAMMQRLTGGALRLPSASYVEPPKPQSGPTPRPVTKRATDLKEKKWWQYVGDLSWFLDNASNRFVFEELGDPGNPPWDFIERVSYTRNYLLHYIPRVYPFGDPIRAKWPDDWKLISRTRLWRHYVEYTGTPDNFSVTTIMVEAGDALPGQWLRCERPEALGEDMLWAIRVVDPNEAPRVRADD
jgi:hypothetical protein